MRPMCLPTLRLEDLVQMRPERRVRARRVERQPLAVADHVGNQDRIGLEHERQPHIGISPVAWCQQRLGLSSVNADRASDARPSCVL